MRFAAYHSLSGRKVSAASRAVDPALVLAVDPFSLVVRVLMMFLFKVWWMRRTRRNKLPTSNPIPQ